MPWYAACQIRHRWSAGTAGSYANAKVSDAQRDVATQLMEAVGIVEWVEEEVLLDAVTAVSGSAPAYFFLMFEAMEEAAVKLGLPAATARRLAIQTKQRWVPPPWHSRVTKTRRR